MAYKPMKGRIRPLGDRGDEAVPDRIEMQVIDMAAVIGLISDQVFPITPLPDGGFLAPSF